MKTIEAEVLFRPDLDQLRFLPEGPYPLGPGIVSWVAIQHGGDSPIGSINVLSLDDGRNRSVPLTGRPGFAFPADEPDVFVVGLERHLQRVNLATGESQVLSDEVDADVEGTIINDGVAFAEGYVFGCKDLKFAEKKAGLYLWRSSDQATIRLRDDQTCSNGKVIRATEDGWTLLDIDTPTQKVVRYSLDVDAGKLGLAETVLDLTAESMFPDGMIETPDGESLIIAFYNPQDAPYGVARQYNLASGEIETEWRCPRSPQVTCPQLVEFKGRLRLVLTTAVEHMSAERQKEHDNAGCIFMAETGNL
jgi:sugar lactone lactonase YvrE